MSTHFAYAHRNEGYRTPRPFAAKLQADTQLPDFESSPWLAPEELGLALELWRVRGCPDGGMPEAVQRASAILKSAAYSR